MNDCERRPSVFQAGHAQVWRGSCGRYALLSVTAARLAGVAVIVAVRLDHESRWPGVTRLCAWCQNPIPAKARRDAVCCSVRCRQARHRFLRAVGRADSVATGRPLRLAWSLRVAPPLHRTDCCRPIRRREGVKGRFARTLTRRLLPVLVALRADRALMPYRRRIRRQSGRGPCNFRRCSRHTLLRLRSRLACGTPGRLTGAAGKEDTMIPTFFLGGVLHAIPLPIRAVGGCAGFAARARGEGTRRLCLRPDSG